MLETLSSFSVVEWVGLVTGVIYVVLSAQNKIYCWFFGIVSCACIAYHDFFGGLQLYSDGLLQVFYIVMGFIGLYRWKNVEVSFKNTPKTHLYVAAVGVAISLLYGYLMSMYTDTYFPMIDAFTTVFSVIATIFLINRQLSAWLYFILIDVVMTYVYFIRDWELYAALYFIFTIVAIYASWNWLRLFRLNLNK